MATGAQLVGRRAPPRGCPATEQSTDGTGKLGSSEGKGSAHRLGMWLRRNGRDEREGSDK
jgi:hypothetical protein